MGRFLAVFYSDKTGPRWAEWYGLSAQDRAARDAAGLAALADWDARHRDDIVYDGGPLGPTLRVEDGQIALVVNQLTVFMVVRADTQAAAAALFLDHPHCTIFPCHAVDVMPLLGG